MTRPSLCLTETTLFLLAQLHIMTQSSVNNGSPRMGSGPDICSPIPVASKQLAPLFLHSLCFVSNQPAVVSAPFADETISAIRRLERSGVIASADLRSTGERPYHTNRGSSGRFNKQVILHKISASVEGR